MKRWISATLIFIMIFTLGPWTPVQARSEEVEPVEAEAVGTAPDDDIVASADAGEDADALPDVEVGELAESKDASDEIAFETSEDAIYAIVTAETAKVYDAPGGNAIARISRGGVVLVTGQAAGRWFRIAFNTDRGIVTGCAEADALTLMSGSQAGSYMDALAESGSVALYQDSIDLPLALIDCAFIDGEAEEDVVEEEPAGETDETETIDPEANETEIDETETEAAGDAEGDADVIAEEAEGADEGSEGGEASVPGLIEVNRGAITGVPVPEGDADGTTVPQSELRLSSNSLVIGVGEVYTRLSVSCTTRSSDFTIIWSSSDASCATVDPLTGAITGVAAGTAIITVTSNSGATDTCIVVVRPAPAGMEISTGASWFIGLGETYDGLEVIVNAATGEAAASGSIYWTSSNPSVISINSTTGAITGVSVGSANITARAYNGRTATRRVTVKPAPQAISLNRTSLSLNDGGMTSQLNAFIPSGTASARITYTTSDAHVAQVSPRGLVTAMGRGTARITATTFNGLSATCDVTIYSSPSVIRFESNELTLGVGQRAAANASALAADGSDTVSRLVYFVDSASPNPDCISLDATTGVITAVSAGQAIVNVRTQSGLQAQAPCAVTVVAAPTSLYISSGAWTIGAGETYAGLRAVLVKPAGENVAAASIAWSSGNPAVATVDPATGAVTGVAPGTASITARTHNGKSATCTLTVKEAPAAIILNRTEATLFEDGGSVQLTATLPVGTASAAITYATSDENVATVTPKGLVRPVGPGTAVITASAFNGKSAACEVTVHGAAREVAFDETALVLDIDETAVVNATALASNGLPTVTGLRYYIDETSPNPDCIELNEITGEVTALASGRAIVNVRTDNGTTAAEPCVIDVYVMPTAISLDVAFTKPAVGETCADFTYAISGPYGFDTLLTWTSSDPGVATVTPSTNTASGSVAIAANAVGTATITATARNGLSASRTIEVLNAPDSISLSPSEQRIYKTQTAQFVIAFPSGTGSSYTFSIADESVATVSANGVVTGVNPGMTTLTATTVNGATATATVIVTDAGTPSIPSGMPTYLASTTNYYFPNMTSEQKLEYVIYCAQQKLGCPYVYGASGPNNFDCSGFVRWSFRQIGIYLGDSAYAQGYDNSYTRIDGVANLKRGDVVFFDTESDSDLCDHSAIYLGSGYFMHASSSSSARKVIISQLNDGYYSENYYYSASAGGYRRGTFSWGRRILP